MSIAASKWDWMGSRRSVSAVQSVRMISVLTRVPCCANSSSRASARSHARLAMAHPRPTQHSGVPPGSATVQLVGRGGSLATSRRSGVHACVTAGVHVLLRCSCRAVEQMSLAQALSGLVERDRYCVGAWRAIARGVVRIGPCAEPVSPQARQGGCNPVGAFRHEGPRRHPYPSEAWRGIRPEWLAPLQCAAALHPKKFRIGFVHVEFRSI